MCTRDPPSHPTVCAFRIHESLGGVSPLLCRAQVLRATSREGASVFLLPPNPPCVLFSDSGGPSRILLLKIIHGGDAIKIDDEIARENSGLHNNNYDY